VHLRVAPEALARGVIAGLLACCCLPIACRAAAGDVSVTWTIEPARPLTGSVAVVRFTLHNNRGQPLRGARLKLAAHMSHPGMAVVAADVLERGDGTYESRLELSMAGEWALVVTGELADGRRITNQTTVAVIDPPHDRAAPGIRTS
jgi:YtkA-like